MRLILIFIFSIVSLFANIGEITASRGEVYSKISNSVKKISLGYKFDKKDIIFTKKGSAQLTFSDNTVVTLGINSKLVIEQYFLNSKNIKKSKVKFRFAKGLFKSITGAIGHAKHSNFKVLTKTATIGIRGTIFRVKVVPPAPNLKIPQTMAAVDQGSIVVTSKTGASTVVNVGEAVGVDISGKIKPVPFNQLKNISVGRSNKKSKKESSKGKKSKKSKVKSKKDKTKSQKKSSQSGSKTKKEGSKKSSSKESRSQEKKKSIAKSSNKNSKENSTSGTEETKQTTKRENISSGGSDKKSNQASLTSTNKQSQPSGNLQKVKTQQNSAISTQVTNSGNSQEIQPQTAINDGTSTQSTPVDTVSVPEQEFATNAETPIDATQGSDVVSQPEISINTDALTSNIDSAVSQIEQTVDDTTKQADDKQTQSQDGSQDGSPGNLPTLTPELPPIANIDDILPPPVLNEAQKTLYGDNYVSFGYWQKSDMTPDTMWIVGKDITDPDTIIDDYIINHITANYSGVVKGIENGKLGEGNINLNIDFGSQSINGNIDFQAPNESKWSMSVDGNAYANGFEGTLKDKADSEVENVTGTLNGNYFGCNAEAVGGSFSATSSNKKVDGIFEGVKQ